MNKNAQIILDTINASTDHPTAETGVFTPQGAGHKGFHGNGVQQPCQSLWQRPHP